MPLAIAEGLASTYASADINTLAAAGGVWHAAAYYAPTGGNKASEQEVAAVQQTIRSCATDYGYPEPPRGEAARAFDIQCGIYLCEQLHIHPSEASHLELWAFLTTILAPDIVRWRFWGEHTAVERFIGSDRGLRRNTFGRLWWRAYLLRQPQLKEPYKLFHLLVEDDLVQLTERNSIAADPTLMAVLCAAFLRVSQQYPVLARRTLMREGIKRVRRLLSMISFTALDRPTLQQVLMNIFTQTAQSLILAEERQRETAQR
jgi:hypothetical protein